MSTDRSLSGRVLHIIRHRTTGSTLLETIAAVGLLAVAMSIMAQFMFQGVHESRLASRRAQAVLLAQDRLEDILAHRADLAAWEAGVQKDFVLEKTSGLYRFDRKELGSYRWSWEIKDLDGRLGMKKASVHAYYSIPYGETRRAKVTLETLLSLPGTARAVAGAGVTDQKEGQP